MLRDEPVKYMINECTKLAQKEIGMTWSNGIQLGIVRVIKFLKYCQIMYVQTRMSRRKFDVYNFLTFWDINSQHSYKYQSHSKI